MDRHKINKILSESVYEGFFDAIGLIMADGMINNRAYFKNRRICIDPYSLSTFSQCLFQGSKYSLPFLFKITGGVYYNMAVNKSPGLEDLSKLINKNGGLTEQMVEILNVMLGEDVSSENITGNGIGLTHSLTTDPLNKSEVIIEDDEYDEHYYELISMPSNVNREYLILGVPEGDFSGNLSGYGLRHTPFFDYIKNYKLVYA